MPRSFLVKRNGTKEGEEQASDGQHKALQEPDSSQYLEYAITLLALSKNTQWAWDYELEKSYWFDTTSKGTFTALLNDDKPIDPYKPLSEPDSDVLLTVNALTTLKDSKIAYSTEKPTVDTTNIKETKVVENKENRSEFYDWFSLQTSKDATIENQLKQTAQEKPSLFEPSRALPGQTHREIYLEPHHNFSFVEQLTSRMSSNLGTAVTRPASDESSENSAGHTSPASSSDQTDGHSSPGSSGGRTSPGSSIGQSEGSYSTGHSSPDEGIMIEDAVVDISPSDDMNRNIQQFLLNNPLAYDDIAMETKISKQEVQRFVESQDAVSAENKQKIITWYMTKILKQPANENDESYTCHKCGKIFTYRSYLERHIKYVCPDSTGRTWKCSFCGKAFQYPCYLRRHVRSHTGESPYKCEKCDRAFVRSTDLQRHIRNHTGEKPYRCTQCSRAFARSTDLKRHMRTHTGEKPYKCWKCGKSFSQSGSLQTHLHTHEKDLQTRQKDGTTRQKNRTMGAH